MEEDLNSYACNDVPSYTGNKVETENYSLLKCCEVWNTNEKEAHVLLYIHHVLKEFNASSDFIGAEYFLKQLTNCVNFVTNKLVTNTFKERAAYRAFARPVAPRIPCPAQPP